jgi:hypothetical protein
MSDLSPLRGAKRKLDFGAVRAAFDPTRTLRAIARWLVVVRLNFPSLHRS